MNDQDSFEMETASGDTYSSMTKTSPKRPKVYSAFIQKDNSRSHSNQLTDATYIKYNNKPQSMVKKPKFNGDKRQPDLNNSFNDDPNMLVNVEEEADPIIESVIGLNTFYCENVFPLDKNHLLISLDSNRKDKKNSFCFKGKCSIAALHGNLGKYWLLLDTT